jgi:uncharacterized protein (TIGR03435 family)
MNDDLNLLREFARNNSEEAFAALVARHLNLVYSVALRSVRDAHLAEEITQAVFIILARKADSLGDKIILSGWLCRTARYASANALKIQRRRQQREQEAFMQSTLNESEPAETWNQIAPLLDGAMEKLGQKDHDALVLRFFENKTFAEVGASLGASEDAAKMRVNRALEKLRKFFTKRGVSSTTAIIAGTISANSVQAAPVALAKTVTAVAIVKGAAASGSTLTLIKGALKIMAWTKAKTAIVAGAVVLLAAGTTTVLVKFNPTINDSFFKTEYQSLLDVPPNISIIRPTHFAKEGGGSYWLYSPVNKAVGRNVSLEEMLDSAYDFSSSRMILPANLPTGHFDYLITKPHDVKEEFQSRIKRQFGLAGREEMRETDVLLLELKTSNAPNVNLSAGGNGFTSRSGGAFSGTNQPISQLAAFAEGIFHLPVLDQTGLTNNFDFNLVWDEYGKKRGDYPNLEGLKRALINQLGLELVPTNMPIEMLVVEKVK